MIIYSISKRFKNFIKVKIYAYFDFFTSRIKASLLRPTQFDGKNGIKRLYFENGNIKLESNYKNGKLNGISNLYFETGELMRKENYKEDKLNGIARVYEKSGKITKELYYDNGTLLQEKTF